MDDVFKAILKKQGDARRRGDAKDARKWDDVEASVKDALADYYGGMLTDEDAKRATAKVSN